jgi:hypothetical protein
MVARYRNANPEKRRETSRRAYLKHRTKWVAQAHERAERRKVEDPIGVMLNRKRGNASRAGIEFTITRTDLVIPELCPVLGIPLAPVGARDFDAAPSIDRLVLAYGYVPGNVAVISNRANMLKGAGTAEEHERIAAWMRSRGLP